jgi:hypothetical protein
MGPPSTGYFDRLMAMARGKIKIMTIAAELSGAAEFTAYAVSKGVTISIGHTLANAADLQAAVDAGERQLVTPPAARSHARNVCLLQVRACSPTSATACRMRSTATTTSVNAHPPRYVLLPLHARVVVAVISGQPLQIGARLRA